MRRLLPDKLLTMPDTGANSRERIYTLSRTFWCFLWQVLQRMASCREVVRQVQALFQREADCTVGDGTGAYCQARQRLPLAMLETALAATAHSADRVAPQRGGDLQGRPIKIVNGSTLELSGHAQQSEALSPGQSKGCGFPLLKLIVIFSLRSGALLARHTGNKHLGERQGLQACQSVLSDGDILMGDRQFGSFVTAAWAQGLGINLLARVPTGSRHVNFREGKRLGPYDRLATWHKPKRIAPGFTPQQWAAVPDQLTVRILRVRVSRQGFRTREITLVTTLLDPVAYPPGKNFSMSISNDGNWILLG